MKMLGLLMASGCYCGLIAQGTPEARDMFFGGFALRTDTRQNKTPEKVRPVPSQRNRPERDDGRMRRHSGGTAQVDVPHLGLRYTVQRVTNKKTGTRERVDPDAVFHAGDCLSIEIEANRTGFLSVFNSAATGSWQQLLPSSEMPTERTRIKSRQAILVPEKHCFELDDNPGTERLIVVIADLEKDGLLLSQDTLSVLRPQPNTTALTRLGDPGVISRDIRIAKIGPVGDGHEINSVYVAKSTPTVTDRLVVEILLRHK